MWPIKESKEEYIPISQTSWGFVQRSNYVQRDLYHEEIIELDSPFAEFSRADTDVFNFLLLGDQNAGKSTFLHAWTFEMDPNFLDLVTELPILTSSFVNSRFLGRAESTVSHARDEPPFIDTDIAKASVLITMEDFMFWLQERGIPAPTDLRPNSSYVLLQFVEIGGDHLDRIIAGKDVAIPAEIIHNSRQLLQQAFSSVYFINAASCISVDASGCFQLNQEAFNRTKARISFLFEQALSAQHRLLIYVSRLPHTPDDFEAHKLCENMEASLRASLGQAVGKRLLGVVPAHVLSTSSSNAAWESIDSHHILSIVARLFGSSQGARPMTAFQAAPDQVDILFSELLRCARKHRNKGTTWITDELFSECLEHSHSLTVPPATLLQRFLNGGCQTLATEYNLIMIHWRCGFSDIQLVFELESGQLFWFPRAAEEAHWQMAVRFPTFPPLAQAVSQFAEMNIPPEFWIHKAGAANAPHKSILSSLVSAQSELQLKIESNWSDMLASNKWDDIDWLLLVDEWVFAERLIRSASPDATHATNAFRAVFPIELPSQRIIDQVPFGTVEFPQICRSDSHFDVVFRLKPVSAN